MKISWSLFAHIAQMLAPGIIAVVAPELSPISTIIGAGISEAEQIPGASGPDKLQHVLNLANDAAQGVNDAQGKPLLDPGKFNTAASNAINTTVAVVNLIQSAQKVAATPSASSTTGTK